MNREKLEEGIRILHDELRMLKTTRFTENKDFVQHGNTSLYQHCISVAYRSIIIAAKFNLDIDMHSMIRGALLHDYYLYDWHNKEVRSKLHGFRHPRIAYENAARDFQLNSIEQDIIRKHMFPLTPKPPMHKEGWVICAADKLCSIQETLKMGTSFSKPIPFL